jgi:hypothetical protein
VALATGDTMIIGFTGTREKLTDLQLAWLYETLEMGKRDGTIKEVHHGACLGADAAVHAAAIDNDLFIHVWPPVNMKYVAPECLSPPFTKVTIHPRMQYLDRDRQIVGAAAGLVALPKHNEQPERMLWGGTWYTVDFAQRMNKPVIICYPNGVVEQRYPEANTTMIQY